MKIMLSNSGSMIFRNIKPVYYYSNTVCILINNDFEVKVYIVGEATTVY